MIPLHKYKWLLFDLDNTLIDFHEPSLRSFYDLCRTIGLQPNKATYKVYQLENDKVWKMYEAGKITSIELRSLRFEYFFNKMELDLEPMYAHEQYIAGLIKYSEPSPSVLRVLDTLSQTHRLAIITNGLKEAQRPRLLNSGLSQYFDYAIISDEIGVAKPQVAYFDHVIKTIDHHDKSELLVIGDSLGSDILGANDSNIDCVWLNPKNLKTHSRIVPTYEVRDLEEMV